MRMRRSFLQWRMSASQASCSFCVHGVDPPSQAPLMLWQPGAGICCPLGENFESCAETMLTAARRAVATKGVITILMSTLLNRKAVYGAQYKTFQTFSLTISAFRTGTKA